MLKIIPVKNKNEGGKITAKIIIDMINEKENATLGLATGSSPESTYKELVMAYERGKVSFDKVRTINLDEYVGVPKDSDQSYHFYMYDRLFSKVDIREENINIPNGMAEDLDEECKRYNDVIRSLSPVDIQLLGIGHNGHIGFNEPSEAFAMGTHVVELSKSTIEANSRFFNDESQVPKQAITMGVGQIMKARNIVLLAFGLDKSEILYRALYGEISSLCPASILQKHDNLIVVADYDAITQIRNKIPGFEN